LNHLSLLLLVLLLVLLLLVVVVIHSLHTLPQLLRLAAWELRSMLLDPWRQGAHRGVLRGSSCISPFLLLLLALPFFTAHQ
jgi:hypothetical protein